MVSKALFVCLVAVSLINSNEAIFGFDVVVENAIDSLITDANNVAQNVSAETIGVLISLQNTIQNATASLNTQIVGVLNTVIADTVAATGGAQSKIANCTQQNQATLTAFEISSLNAIITTCVTGDITSIISIISGISAAVNNITNIVVNVRPTVATACPAPAAGDILGSIGNAFCALGSVSSISGQLTAQGVIVAANIQQASALVAKITLITAILPACVSAELSVIAINALPVISPVIQCTIR